MDRANVTLLPLHNPVELAELGAFLDVATGGRFLFGIGLGYRPEEYAIYGIPMSLTMGVRGRSAADSAECRSPGRFGEPHLGNAAFWADASRKR